MSDVRVSRRAAWRAARQCRMKGGNNLVTRLPSVGATRSEFYGAATLHVGRGFDPFDPRLLSIKLDVALSLNGLEVSPLSHCIYICMYYVHQGTTVNAGLRTANNGHSPPDQNQTRVCSASRFSLTLKTRQTTLDGCSLIWICGLPRFLSYSDLCVIHKKNPPCQSFDSCCYKSLLFVCIFAYVILNSASGEGIRPFRPGTFVDKIRCRTQPQRVRSLSPITLYRHDISLKKFMTCLAQFFCC
uniref:SFRICE_034732 n=1 Tax=Spodoptera frugiperda TaxID=7108 RepID=A0A2H1W102_SPOFR